MAAARIYWFLAGALAHSTLVHAVVERTFGQALIVGVCAVACAWVARREEAIAHAAR